MGESDSYLLMSSEVLKGKDSLNRVSVNFFSLDETETLRRHGRVAFSDSIYVGELEIWIRNDCDFYKQ